MKTPILGQAYVARSVNAADNRLVNLFPEAIPEGGKTQGFFSRCPGLSVMGTFGDGPIRGMWKMGDCAYVVSGGYLYKVTSAWVSSQIGAVGETGQVSMSDNGLQIFIACGPLGYIYTLATNILSQISSPNFHGAVTVAYLDGYFVFNEPSSQKIWVTSLLDGTRIDALEFASAEGSPDNITAIAIDHREVWVFGTNSIEIWYDAGMLDFPLARLQGAFNEVGCNSPYSIAKLDNSLFWLGSDARGDGVVYRSQGYAAVRISTHAIEYAIQGYATISDAIGYTYQQEGHSFYVLTFPTADRTWVYDVATQAWHERASFVDGQFHRHLSNCQLNFNGKSIVGDYQNGNLYQFNLDKYTDAGAVQKWLRSWRALPTGQNNLKRTTHHSLQLDCESGMGIPSNIIDAGMHITTESLNVIVTEGGVSIVNENVMALDSYSQVLLRWSDDGGHTWSNYHTRSVGSIGETGTRVIWRRLGMTSKLRDRIYEISGSDPVKIAIMGAELIISPTAA